MKGKISKLVERIENLKEILNTTIRYDESDIRRLVELKIKDTEKELRVLRVQSKINY
jgi:hypothetical protein